MLNEEKKSEGKMELVHVTRELMPGGKPSFKTVVQYPQIKQLVSQYGDNVILKNIFLLVKDFCSGINVVRNMNEDQMIDAAAMLLDECENFRMEDYVMMFSMAKKGELFEFRDRIDLQVISEIMDAYYVIRKKEGDRLQEEEGRMYEHMGDQTKLLDTMHKEDAKILELADKFTAGFDGLRQVLNQTLNSGTKKYTAQELYEIEQRDREAIRQKTSEWEANNPPPPKIDLDAPNDDSGI